MSGHRNSETAPGPPPGLSLRARCTHFRFIKTGVLRVNFSNSTSILLPPPASFVIYHDYSASNEPRLDRRYRVVQELTSWDPMGRKRFEYARILGHTRLIRRPFIISDHTRELGEEMWLRGSTRPLNKAYLRQTVDDQTPLQCTADRPSMCGASHEWSFLIGCATRLVWRVVFRRVYSRWLRSTDTANTRTRQH